MSVGQTERGKKARVSAIAFTALALVLTILSALLMANLMSRASLDQEAVRPVVVARVALKAGQPIDPANLRVADYPTSSVPDGAYSKIEDVVKSGSRVPLHSVVAGEAILRGRLSSKAGGTGIAPLVPADMRAFPVSVDGWVARSKLLYPGAMVDVLTTIRLSGERKTITKVVLQNLKVLSVDGAVDGIQYAGDTKKKKVQAARSRSTVTLLVKPEQAEALALATREGKLDLMLRNAQDAGHVVTGGMTAPELLGRDVETENEASAQTSGKRAKRSGSKLRRTRRAPPPARRSRAPKNNGTKSLVLP